MEFLRQAAAVLVLLGIFRKICAYPKGFGLKNQFAVEIQFAGQQIVFQQFYLKLGNTNLILSLQISLLDKSLKKSKTPFLVTWVV